MADRFYKDVELPDLQEGVSLQPPQSGFIQIYGRAKKLAFTDSDGAETVLGGLGDRIESPNGSAIPANVIASDNSVAINFANQPRIVYRIGGVDFFANEQSPYSYRFRDISGLGFAGLCAPDQVSVSYFSMLPTAIGPIGSCLSVSAINGNQQQIGYKFPVTYVAGNPELTAANFQDRNQVYVTGAPAHLKVLDDDGNVRSVFNEDQTNFLYWKSAGTINETNAKTIYVQPTDPALTGPVEDGSIWLQA